MQAGTAAEVLPCLQLPNQLAVALLLICIEHGVYPCRLLFHLAVYVTAYVPFLVAYYEMLIYNVVALLG